MNAFTKIISWIPFYFAGLALLFFIALICGQGLEYPWAKNIFNWFSDQILPRLSYLISFIIGYLLSKFYSKTI